MTTAAADIQQNHKVRGGSALSLALARASPAAVHTISPVNSSGSSATLSSAAVAQEWPSPGSTSPSPAGGGGLAAAAQQAPQRAPATERHTRRLLPFLACFGGGGAAGDDGRSPAAVWASEVGIRPCFYWLEAPTMSEEDRLFAEANARWLKSDCQVSARG